MTFCARMPRQRGARNGNRRKAPASIPRAPGRGRGTTAVIKRAQDVGNLTRPVTDNGQSLGIVPGSLLDWGSLQTMWGVYRLLSVKYTFIIGGEFDGTPAYPTLLVYHDLASLGAPNSLTEAMMKKGVSRLCFNASKSVGVKQFVPRVWTSNGFQNSLPAPSVWSQTATSFAPNFSSLALWGLNFNSTVGSAAIRLVIEMVIEFGEPI